MFQLVLTIKRFSQLEIKFLMALRYWRISLSGCTVFFQMPERRYSIKSSDAFFSNRIMEDEKKSLQSRSAPCYALCLWILVSYEKEHGEITISPKKNGTLNDGYFIDGSHSLSYNTTNYSSDGQREFLNGTPEVEKESLEEKRNDGGMIWWKLHWEKEDLGSVGWQLRGLMATFGNRCLHFSTTMLHELLCVMILK